MPTLASDDTRAWLASDPAEQYGLNLAERGSVDHSMPVFIPDPGTADVIPSWTDADGNIKAKIDLANFNVVTTRVNNHEHDVEGEITITVNKLNEGQPEVRIWYA